MIEHSRADEIKPIAAPSTNKKATHKITKEVVMKELASRELARRRLAPYISKMEPSFIHSWVTKDVCMRLERFVHESMLGKHPRLILNLPPRHSKSLQGSQYMPSWALGNYPNAEFIVCSHTLSLAEEFSKKTRETLRREEYGRIFEKTRLHKEMQNASGWKTNKMGGYLPAGVGGAILGRGAHMLVIDDPFKNFEEAYSDSTREAIWNWFTTTARTRLHPGGGVLVIMQRWHFDDFAGRLIKLDEDGIGEGYELVTYPAIATHDEKFRRKGDALQPRRYDVQALLRLKATMPPRDWEALYQQNPMPAEGQYFKKSQFVGYDELPEVMNIYAAFDLAIGKNDTNDYTVGVVMGLDEKDDLYVLDLVRGRWNAAEIVDELFLVQKKYKPDTIAIEKGQLSMAIDAFLRKRIEEEKLYEMNVKDMPTGRRDKEARARSIQGRMAQGKVYFPLGADWMPDLEREMLQFPAGKHDDQVDAMAWMGLLLQELNPVVLPKEPHPLEVGWRKKLSKYVQGEGKKGFMRA